MKNLTDYLKENLLDHRDRIRYPRHIENPNIIDLMKHNSINELYVTDADLKRLSKHLWSDAVHRNYNEWHDRVVYESLLHSGDADKLLDRIHNKYENYLAYAGETNPNTDTKERSLVIYAKDESLKYDEGFKSLLNLFNYYISFYEKRDGYYEVYIEPYKPEEKTDYIYDKCDGIVYRYVNDNGLKRLQRHGLVPREDKDRHYPKYIFVVADDDKDKLKDTLSKVQDDIKKTNLHLIRIDLKKYHNKIRLFVDPASMNYPAYVTREYIPRYCCQEIKIEEL